jgi:transposase
MKYNGNEDKETLQKGGRKIMTKGRKTAQDERLEIARYCMEHGLNHRATAEKYQVSYQQVYQWVKKYEAKGIDGLIDKRGRTKPEEEMTEIEKLRAENRLLAAEKRRVELELAFLVAKSVRHQIQPEGMVC